MRNTISQYDSKESGTKLFRMRYGSTCSRLRPKNVPHVFALLHPLYTGYGPSKVEVCVRKERYTRKTRIVGRFPSRIRLRIEAHHRGFESGAGIPFLPIAWL